MPKPQLILPKKTDMEEAIINQIPSYEKGKVQYVSATDEVSALFLSAQIVSDLLNKWSTSVAFFSLSCRGEALRGMVKNGSATAKLYTVDQKNPDPQVILRKARGMVNRKFVRAIVIEGVPINPETVTRWSKLFEGWKDTTMVVIGEADDA